MTLELAVLNPAQRDAVLAGAEPLLVLAGAGTGKTTVITYRIAHFLRERGFRPDQILAVTFTNKAAREMRERTARLACVSPHALDIATFHSTCGRLLRLYGDRIGLDRNFTIYDANDQLALVKKTSQELQIDTQSFSPKTLRARIESWKNKGLGPESVATSDLDLIGMKAREVYGHYRTRCLEMNAVDFGDLLLHVVTLLKRDQALLQSLQSRWPALFVDEYQDTNPVQYQLLRLLAKGDQRLTVVGDDDQSIYRWRGADIGNILRFERDFVDARVIRLEENYRSTQCILDVANAVIAHNSSRKGKTLYTQGEEGTAARLRLFASERDEGEALAADCEAWIAQGRSPSELAVLYRVNAQSRPIEDALRRRRLPYAIYGGLRFYERKEIKDALAFLRLLVNPSSDIDLLRIVNVPPRGLGKTSVDKITSEARKLRLSLFEAAASFARGEHRLNGKAKIGIVRLIDTIHKFRTRVDNDHEPGRLVEDLLEEVDYLPMLRREGTEEAESRLQNLAELVAAIDEYTDQDLEPTVSGFLESIALATDVDGLTGIDDSISLMTLHSAKGLEFPIVFLPGLEEGLLPHSRSADNRAGLEEERRLAYVGLTRAKEALVLSAARVRSVFGEPRLSELSRFLGEVPPELLVVSESTNTSNSANRLKYNNQASFDLHGELLDDQDSEMESGGMRASARPSFGDHRDNADDDEGFKAGSRVFHATFGEGVVQGSEGSHRNRKLTVDFPDVGLKIIVARFVDRVREPRHDLDDVPF